MNPLVGCIQVGLTKKLSIFMDIFFLCMLSYGSGIGGRNHIIMGGEKYDDPIVY